MWLGEGKIGVKTAFLLEVLCLVCLLQENSDGLVMRLVMDNQKAV